MSQDARSDSGCDAVGGAAMRASVNGHIVFPA